MRTIKLWLISAFTVLLTVVAVAPARAQAKKFKPEKGVPTFAVREPVLRIQPGDVVETESLYGGYYEKAGGAWPLRLPAKKPGAGSGPEILAATWM